MRLKLFVPIAAAVALSVPAAVNAAEVVVRNGNFEENATLPDGGFLAGHERAIPGWTGSAGSGTGLWNPHSQHFSDEALHGRVGFSAGNGLFGSPSVAMIAQIIQNDVLRANTRYTLTLDVGNYFGTSSSWDYRIGLISNLGANGFVLGQSGGETVAQGTFRTVSYVFEIGATGPGIGQSYAIGLAGFGQGAAFDNVKLDATSLTTAVPEPATWAMMIGGFGLVGGAMRRRAAGLALA